MAVLADMERNTRALVLGTFLTLAVVSLVTGMYPLDVLWDVSNGHRTAIGRSGNTTLLKMIVKICEAAAMVFFLPVMGYVWAALVSQLLKRPVTVTWLLWTLWAVSIMGWLVLSDWLAMGD